MIERDSCPGLSRRHEIRGLPAVYPAVAPPANATFGGGQLPKRHPGLAQAGNQPKLPAQDVTDQGPARAIATITIVFTRLVSIVTL